ncbi:hypothetical protein [Halalkalicoccus tibetensis]|uniref:Uncharacterized protein n=1 Tax=Halalkalicoccus tibetensis TaxID=175632 RepID=A0ABD5V1F7_9EURY
MTEVTGAEADDADPEPEGKSEDEDGDYLDDIDDGSGCTEIWEQLSERRENDD